MKVVVGIDFGTTFTGYGFKFISQNDDNVQLEMNWSDSEKKHPNAKCPSCILYEKTEFKSYGGSAKKDYQEMEDEQKRKCCFIQYFKTFLNYNTDEYVHPNGYKFSNIQIVADYLENIKNKAIEHIDQINETDFNDIYWVVSIPSTWNHKIIQKYKKCLLKAGIIDDINATDKNLLIVREPEAAATCCLYQKKNDESKKSFSFVDIKEIDKDIKDGETTMVIDCGGGTVDITCYISEKRMLKEITINEGSDDCGSVSINQSFLSYIEKITPRDDFNDFKECPGNIYELENDIETAKKSIKDYNDTNFEIPRDLAKKIDTKMILNKNRLKLNSDSVKSIFNPTIEKVLNLIKKVYQNLTKGYKLNHIYIVGGFSENEILKKSIQEKYPNQNFYCPDFSGSSVIRGCVFLGINPKLIITRKSKYTYGVEGKRPFKNGDNEDYYKFENGKLWLTKVFDIFVKKKQDVFYDDVIKKEYKIDKNYSYTEINIYGSNDEETPIHVDEKECSLLGNIKINNDKSDLIYIIMKFGNTHIDIEVLNSKNTKMNFQVEFESFY